MRIERDQHPVDRRLDQLALVDFLDILVADALEHDPEQVELFVDSRFLDLLREERTGHLRRRQDPGQNTASGGHRKLVHFVSLLAAWSVAKNSAGSTGVPPCLVSI